MTLFAALLGLTPTALAQVTPTGPFVGSLTPEGFETQGQQAGAMCIVPGVFGGSTSMCTPGNGGTNITSGWGYQCNLFPHGGSWLYGSMAGYTEFTFVDPVSDFGGFFGTNSLSRDFQVEFWDAAGNRIDTVVETYPGMCTWSWFGWNIGGAGATRITVGGGVQGGAFVMMDDLQANDDPDPDGDGVPVPADNCPADANPAQSDVDLDVVGDVCDNCPLDPNPNQEDADNNGVGDACDCGGADTDRDGVEDGCDVCPQVRDPLQRDFDADGVGDLCDRCPQDFDALDRDTDLDTVGDACDVCPNVADPGQADADSDGQGDVCDDCPDPSDPTDSDGDSVCDDDDVCPDHNDFADVDEDGVADGCDPCPLDAADDTDGDGVCDSDDLCPLQDDTGPDADADGFVDGCDNCGSVWQRDQRDYDKDGFGDLCDCKVGLPEVHPGADELCNGDDDDCDGAIDEEAIDAIAVWPDADGDGQGNTSAPWTACEPGNGYVLNDLDCDDEHAEAFEGGLEICDELDNDCDGVVDPDELSCEPDTSVTGESTICGCASTTTPVTPVTWMALLGGGLLLRRRRRPTA